MRVHEVSFASHPRQPTLLYYRSSFVLEISGLVSSVDETYYYAVIHHEDSSKYNAKPYPVKGLLGTPMRRLTWGMIQIWLQMQEEQLLDSLLR